jgi:hypothetical protein
MGYLAFWRWNLVAYLYQGCASPIVIRPSRRQNPFMLEQAALAIGR